MSLTHRIEGNSKRAAALWTSEGCIVLRFPNQDIACLLERLHRLC
jgi:very-short-patch-repair endonuclease